MTSMWCIQRVIRYKSRLTEVILELFEWLLSRYQTGSVESMEGSDFVFDCENLLNHICDNI